MNAAAYPCPNPKGCDGMVMATKTQGYPKLNVCPTCGWRKAGPDTHFFSASGRGR
jgi:hypothetical protein